MLLLQSGAVADWVGPTMALSLLVIALSFVIIAAAVALTAREATQRLHHLGQTIEGLRRDVAPALQLLQRVSDKGERVATLVTDEADQLVRSTRALREGIEDRIQNLQVVYDVLADEVEETAVEAAVTLRSFRGGFGWFGLLRRLLRLGRRR